MNQLCKFDYLEKNNLIKVCESDLFCAVKTTNAKLHLWGGKHQLAIIYAYFVKIRPTEEINREKTSAFIFQLYILSIKSCLLRVYAYSESSKDWERKMRLWVFSDRYIPYLDYDRIGRFGVDWSLLLAYYFQMSTKVASCL